MSISDMIDNNPIFSGVLTILLIAVIFNLIFQKLCPHYDTFTVHETKNVLSHVDGINYHVHKNHESPQKAADTLAELNKCIVDLIRVLRNKYIRGPAGDIHPERRQMALRLLAHYNPDNITENSPKNQSGDTSYTINKGKLLAICLREKNKDNQIHDINILTFVVIHEMAHIAIIDINHPARFWSAFRLLLEEAELANIYTSPQYAKFPKPYCGMIVDYNPLYDDTVIPL